MSEIFVDGKDTGYRKDSRWWWDESSPDGFRIANPNEDYPKEYFKEDHVGAEVVKNYCNAVIRGYELLAGEMLDTVIEFGSGGGWFTREFKNRGYSIQGLEGSYSGAKECERKQIYNCRITDFRKKMNAPEKKFQIALCTEVAGHIEPPFSATLVSSLVDYSDVVWWSSEEPDANEPHLHHPNEQSYKFWINLFDFFGYSPILLSDEIFNSCERRGRYMFYSRLKFPQYENIR